MLILIQLPGKLTHNKIGLTKVLKYNFADIVTGILPKNHFYESYLGFRVMPIWQTRQSNKHKRKSGRQEIRQTLVKDNPANKTIWGVWSFPTCLFAGISFINVYQIIQFAGLSCMTDCHFDQNQTSHPSNVFSFTWTLS